MNRDCLLRTLLDRNEELSRENGQLSLKLKDSLIKVHELEFVIETQKLMMKHDAEKRAKEIIKPIKFTF